MAASAQTRYYHGSSPAPGPDVTGTTVRHKRADNDIQDANNPLPEPATATYAWAWRKWSKENWTTTPAGAISNLRWFLSTTPPTGIFFAAWLQAVYPLGGASDVADDNGVNGFTDTTANQNANVATQYTSVAPLTIQAGNVLVNPNTGEGFGQGNFVVTQFGVNNTYTGGPGPITAQTLTYRYSET
jgi:hypothetical protein